jgi:hypothetical protein
MVKYYYKDRWKIDLKDKVFLRTAIGKQIHDNTLDSI